MDMELNSSSFKDSQEIPQKHGKKNQNVSPELSWQNVPVGTKSFALSVVDTSLKPNYYVHWLVADIGADIPSLEEGAGGSTRMPAGSKELKPYEGPFPPAGTHNYEFTLYALSTDKLGLRSNASLDEFDMAVKPRALATAKLVGTFTSVQAGAPR